MVLSDRTEIFERSEHDLRQIRERGCASFSQPNPLVRDYSQG